MYQPQDSKGKGRASDRDDDPRRSGNLTGTPRGDEDTRIQPRTHPGGQPSVGREGSTGPTPGDNYAIVSGEAQPSRRPSVSQACIEFCKIGAGDIAQCATFVKSHPEVLGEDTTLLQQFSITAIAKGHEDLFKRCVERLVMINQSKQNPRYISQLSSKTNYRGFQAQCDVVQDSLKTSVSKQTQKPQPPAAATHPASVGAVQPSATADLPSMRNPQRQQSNVSSTDQMGRAMTQPKIRTSSHGQASASQIAGLGSGDQGTESDVSRLSPTNTFGHALATLPGRQRSGTFSHKSSLDKKHYVRDHAKDFFVLGRVIKILWHQPAGANLNGEVNDGRLAVGLYGEPYYSSIRWMMVVKEREGHCICCPISSYGGKGLGGKKLVQQEVRAHAIVYATGTQAVTLPGEPAMTKRPIKVRLALGQGGIDPASRVDFGKVHTIEWNYKVMEVGMVERDHLPLLLRYYQDELGV